MIPPLEIEDAEGVGVHFSQRKEILNNKIISLSMWLGQKLELPSVKPSYLRSKLFECEDMSVMTVCLFGVISTLQISTNHDDSIQDFLAILYLY